MLTNFSQHPFLWNLDRSTQPEALLGREPPTLENTHFQQISFVHQVFPEAEVGEGDLPGPQVEDDVAQLEVAMHDVATVKLLNDPEE